ncbi:hypothetical protein CPC698_1670, partial [Chlamydia psittaci C6/98]
TAPDRLLDWLKPVLTVSYRTRPAQTGFDRLKLDQTSTNRTQTRSDRLKPVLTGSNRSQTCFDQIKPGQTGSNRF